MVTGDEKEAEMVRNGMADNLVLDVYFDYL